jgi:hypothetical protein
VKSRSWTGAPWNEAIAIISLVGHSDMASAAHSMDAAFWKSTRSIEHSEINNDEAWAAIRDDMEASRLSFINAARRHLMKSREPIPRLLARLPATAVGPDQPKSQSGGAT